MRSGPDRARRAQPQQEAADSDESAGTRGPAIPSDIEAKDLAPEVRRELITLDKSTADYIARLKREYAEAKAELAASAAKFSAVG